jgi:hypothetical protein
MLLKSIILARFDKEMATLQQNLKDIDLEAGESKKQQAEIDKETAAAAAKEATVAQEATT